MTIDELKNRFANWVFDAADGRGSRGCCLLGCLGEVAIVVAVMAAILWLLRHYCIIG